MPTLYDATRDLKDLARLAAEPASLEDMLQRALESLQNLVPHDLAAVLALDGDELRVVAARGPLASEAVRRHTLDLRAHPVLRRALESRRPQVLLEHDHAGAGRDPYHGVVELPDGHACMVVPLHAADRLLGLITFDRAVCSVYEQGVVDLADAYGQLIALAFRYAEQSDLLTRYRQLLDERNRVLSDDAGGSCRAVDLIERCPSPLMQGLARQARQVALTHAPVLLLGETGTGKEVLAQAVHCWSARRGGPFLKINCAAIPENLIESELFGHVKGAFTGAVSDRPGRFLAANGGTLLLDEIGDMPHAAQAKLLRVLQEGTFEPVGSDRSVRVDVRILTSTHRDLAVRVAEGRFREDLYYRVNVFPLAVPPLRERPRDLPVLAAEILESIARRSGRGPWTLGPGALEAMAERSWPGNVRQLVNVLERATIMAPAGRLDARFFAGTADPGPALSPAAPAPEAVVPVRPLVDVEREHLRRALGATGGKIYGTDGAAALLGMKPTTLQSRLRKHGIRPRRP